MLVKFYILYKFPALFFLFTTLLLVLWESVSAQQQSVEFIPVEEIKAPFFRPSCPFVNGQNPCFIVVFELPSELLIDYDDDTKALMEQWGIEEQYQRARTGNITVLTFPSHGGVVIVTEPGTTELQLARMRIDGISPGTLLYYRVEKTDGPPQSNRFQITQRGERQPPPRTQRGGLPPARDRDTATAATATTELSMAQQPAKSMYATLEYSNTIRSFSNIFRNEGNGFEEFHPGTAFSLTLYRVNRLASFRVGMAYISSNGGYDFSRPNRDLSEAFELQQFSLFANYSPSFHLKRSGSTHLLFYTDAGVSANLISITYEDIELIQRISYSERISYAFELEESLLPGANIGAGFLVNHRGLGIHAGINVETVIFENFKRSMTSAYPVAGINFRIR